MNAFEKLGFALFLAAFASFVWTVWQLCRARHERPPAPPRATFGDIRYRLIEGFSVWAICEELKVSAEEVHWVLAEIVKEKR